MTENNRFAWMIALALAVTVIGCETQREESTEESRERAADEHREHVEKAAEARREGDHDEAAAHHAEGQAERDAILRGANPIEVEIAGELAAERADPTEAD